MAPVRRPLASWATLLRQRATAAGRTTFARRPGRQTQTRGYALFDGKGGGPKRGDAPWFLGSVAVTAPTLWYLGIWTPSADDHHDDHHDEKHGDEGGEEKEASEGKEDDAGEDAGEEKASDSEGDDSKGDPSKDAKEDDATTDEAAVNKAPQSQNQISGKQEGVANADTKHSTNPVEEGRSGGKPEGGADTAKARGTVDVNRPQN